MDNRPHAPTSHVLVVEDDRDLAELMSWVLQSAGFDVTTAYDGRTGLAALERSPNSVVVLDLMMPDVDGVEFRARQQSVPATSAAPVLIVSARHDAAAVAATLGVAGFLPKPFAPEELVDAVSRIALRRQES